MAGARAFNIFLNDKIGTKYTDKVFSKLVDFLNQQNYDIDVDYRLRMIMIKNTDKKRNDRERLKRQSEEVKQDETATN